LTPESNRCAELDKKIKSFMPSPCHTFSNMTHTWYMMVTAGDCVNISHQYPWLNPL